MYSANKPTRNLVENRKKTKGIIIQLILQLVTIHESYLKFLKRKRIQTTTISIFLFTSTLTFVLTTHKLNFKNKIKKNIYQNDTTGPT